jgi:hypothetical protein
MDLRALIEKMDEIDSTVVEQAGAPTQFTPTHFHKSNVGTRMPLMKTPDGKFWWISQTTDASGMPGAQGIVPWQGNTENRSAWNPASVDGEIQNGKYVDYPEGVTWRTAGQQAAGAGQQPSATTGQSGLPVDNSAEMEKIRELDKLVDKYIEMRALVKESNTNIAKNLVESFGYNYDLTTLTEADAAAVAQVGNVDFSRFLQGGKNLVKGIVKKAATPLAAAIDAKAAWDEIQELPEDMPEDERRTEITRIVSQLIASIGLFWAGAILGALAGSAVFGVGAIVGFIAGGVGGYAANYVLGDDVETIVDALVDKLYGNKPSSSGQDSSASTAPTASSTPAEKPVVGDSDVIALQRMLKKDGYDLGTYGPNGDGIDGKIGPKTISAIQQDLAKLGAKNPDGTPLSVTGTANAATGQAIQQYYLS